MSDERLLMNTFHIFHEEKERTILQCPVDLNFTLDGRLISCVKLQKVVLPETFKIEHNGKLVTSQHLTSNAMKFKSWAAPFQFGNMMTFQEVRPQPATIWHPVLDDFVFTKLGEMRTEAKVGLSVGSTLLAAVVCLLCYCRMPCFRLQESLPVAGLASGPGLSLLSCTCTGSK